MQKSHKISLCDCESLSSSLGLCRNLGSREVREEGRFEEIFLKHHGSDGSTARTKYIEGTVGVAMNLCSPHSTLNDTYDPYGSNPFLTECLL